MAKLSNIEKCNIEDLNQQLSRLNEDYKTQQIIIKTLIILKL